MLPAHLTVVLGQGFAEHNLVVRGAPVFSQYPREHEVFPADLTLEGFLSGMEVLVLFRVGADVEGFVADLATVLGGALVSSDVCLGAVLGGVGVVAEMTRVFVLGVVLLGVQRVVDIVVVGVAAVVAT